MGGELQRLGDRRRPRRRGAVERVGGPHHQLLGVVGGVEPAAGPLRVGEMVQRDVEQAGRRVQPGRLAGQLMQRQQARWPASRGPRGSPRCRRPGRRGWRAATGRRRRAGRACRGAHCVAASRNSGRPSATPASASAVIASPFHAVTTLSSRPGCGRVEPGGQQRGPDPVEPLRRRRGRPAAAAPSCRVRRCPASVTLKSRCGPTPVVVARVPRAAARASRRRSGPRDRRRRRPATR